MSERMGCQVAQGLLEFSSNSVDGRHLDQKFVVLKQVGELSQSDVVHPISNNQMRELSNNIYQSTMDKGKIDKNTPVHVFESKPLRRDFGFKISAADVFNDFLYVGDDKGNIYYFPVKVNDPQIIPKGTQEQTKNITKYRIDKLQCYQALSSVLALADEKLYLIDSALRKPEMIAQKVHDFSINEIQQEGSLQGIAVITKKKEGYLIFMNPHTKKLEESKKFSLNELPSNVGFNGTHIICSYKKEYETYNVERNFGLAKGPLQTRNPFFKITGPNEIVFFMDDIGLFMDSQFTPIQKDNITLASSRPLINIGLNGNHCLILCEGSLQIFSIFDPKKCSFVQEMNLSPAIRGITSNRPFVFGRDELLFLYEIPYQTQIRSLLERCRVEEALALLIQNVGENQPKIEQLKMNAVWPLLRKMELDKARELIKSINFDIRQLALLYPELSSTLDIDSIKGIKPDKYMATLITEYLGEKPNKGPNEESELKKKSKLFLKEVLEFKREQYLSRANLFKVKIQFNTSKYSLIRQKIVPATPEELLEVIDFYLVKLHLNMESFTLLDKFFRDNQTIYCKRLFEQFQGLIKNNEKLIAFASLKPRFYTIFDKLEEAFEGWKFVAENGKDEAQKNQAYEEAVKLLTQFENKTEVLKRLFWILKKKPETGMSFFKMIDINFIQPEQIIKNFQDEQNYKYLELYLEIIVLDKKTDIESYHTKLLLLYLKGIFQLNDKEQKEELKTRQFAQKIDKFRKLLRNPEAKYASEPILKKIEKCEWMLEDEIFLYSRQKRHEQALKKYIEKNMTKQAEEYCNLNREGTLTIYFKLLLAMYKTFESSKNNSHILWKKDIITFLKKYSSEPQLDPITVLEMIPDSWLLTENDGGIYQFLESAIIHTLHERRATYTSKHLSQMDLLNVQYNLIQAKRAYLRFTYKKKCCICETPISDKYFVVYPNANVCHQACVKKQKNTICPVTKQDFEKTFKY